MTGSKKAFIHSTDTAGKDPDTQRGDINAMGSRNIWTSHHKQKKTIRKSLKVRDKEAISTTDRSAYTSQLPANQSR